jgi:hypothetical protein
LSFHACNLIVCIPELFKTYLLKLCHHQFLIISVIIFFNTGLKLEAVNFINCVFKEIPLYFSLPLILVCLELECIHCGSHASFFFLLSHVCFSQNDCLLWFYTICMLCITGHACILNAGWKSICWISGLFGSW